VGELEHRGVYTPSDIAAGTLPEGPVVVFDFDNYYMGSAIAEHLAKSVDSVTYVTPAGHASAWVIMTNEQPQVHRALERAGVGLVTLSYVTSFEDGELVLANLFTGANRRLPCRSLVIVGMRAAHDELYTALVARGDELSDAGIRSVDRIGDALAPGAIAHAVHSGHRFARELDDVPGMAPYRRDAPIIESAPVLYESSSPTRPAA
jgi:dimethylamine/trimethylamine dehydrogenase